MRFWEGLNSFSKITVLIFPAVLVEKKKCPEPFRGVEFCKNAIQFKVESAEEVSFESSHRRIWSTDSKARTALQEYSFKGLIYLKHYIMSN